MISSWTAPAGAKVVCMHTRGLAVGPSRMPRPASHFLDVGETYTVVAWPDPDFAIMREIAYVDGEPLWVRRDFFELPALPRCLTDLQAQAPAPDDVDVHDLEPAGVM